MDLTTYFERIGYDGPRDPNAATLRALHRAHLFAVPFENLDIHLQRPIILERAHLYDKIVTQRRGGFCYEHNGLFSAVLAEMGFEVTRLEARVGARDWESGQPYDHMALVVSLEERWLADVGFGDSFIDPLRLDFPGEQPQSNGSFRVQHDGLEGVYARKTQAGDWHDEYRFRLEPRALADFQPGCDYNQYSPASHFTQQRVSSLATPTGRVTLSDHRLIITENGQRREQDLESEAEFQHYLRQYFGFDLSFPK
jgi:N-hydroxyarylamine O-acetyltransferase